MSHPFDILAPMRPPQHLYHAAPECTFESIDRSGLARASVYASEAPTDALAFVAFTAFHHLHGITTRAFPDGSEHPMPDLVIHDHVYVWQIDTDLADLTWTPSRDHAPVFFGTAITAWVSSGPVPRAALTDYAIYGRNEHPST